jgi:hypothetical protein
MPKASHLSGHRRHRHRAGRHPPDRSLGEGRRRHHLRLPRRRVLHLPDQGSSPATNTSPRPRFWKTRCSRTTSRRAVTGWPARRRSSAAASSSNPLEQFTHPFHSTRSPSWPTSPSPVKLHKDKTVYAVAGSHTQTILKLAKENHIPIDFSCGDGECGTCLVKVSSVDKSQPQQVRPHGRPAQPREVAVLKELGKIRQDADRPDVRRRPAADRVAPGLPVHRARRGHPGRIPEPVTRGASQRAGQCFPGVLARAEAAYLGLALGDALGATVEFMTPREIAHHFGVHREIVGGGWLKLRPGQVTDDTGMSLALGEAILANGGRSFRWPARGPSMPGCGASRWTSAIPSGAT